MDSETPRTANECRICGDNIGPHNEGQDVCLGCHIDGHVKPRMQAREEYGYVPAFGHSNAIKDARTGVAWIDARHCTLADVFVTERAIAQLKEAEARCVARAYEETGDCKVLKE